MKALPWAPLLGLLGCAGAPPSLHPPRPPEASPGPVADPPPSRVTVHVSIFPEALTAQLDRGLPGTGEGEVDFVAGRKLPYQWTREPFQLRFDRGRVVVSTKVAVQVQLLGQRNFNIQITIAGEPVLTPDYRARLQSLEVHVVADGSVERINRLIEEKLKEQLDTTLAAFSLDVRPLLGELYARIARPIPLPLGERVSGCVELRVAAVEAGPTILSGGVEKDLGVVVLPSVSLPCARTSTVPPALPLLANVAALPTGPFQVVVPIAAEYAELSAAMAAAMNGKLFFSKEYPRLYLHSPQIYAAPDESLIIRLQLGGTLDVVGVGTSLEGELYFVGHPRLVDNQLTVPDLELTPGTADGLLRLKVLLDGESMRDQARAALRLDVSERLALARDKLSREISFDEELGCARAELLRAEVTGVYAHQSFLRIYLTVHGQGSVFLPCKR